MSDLHLLFVLAPACLAVSVVVGLAAGPFLRSLRKAQSASDRERKGEADRGPTSTDLAEAPWRSPSNAS